MTIILQNSQNHNIIIDDKPMASGGEGAVYKIQQPHSYLSYCVKLYTSNHRTSEREQKLSYMISNPPAGLSDSLFKVCWPTQIVYQNRKFAGFIMSLAFVDSIQLYELCAPQIQSSLFKVWHDKFSRNTVRGINSRLKLSVNLAKAIHVVHATGKYVLVDMKPQNILITNDGKVSLIDLDSIQINAGSKLFLAKVATPEYVPPEGQVSYNTMTSIGISWDLFSLAVIFYQLLLGLHPYAASFSGKYQHCTTIASSISSGLFVYGKNQNYLHVRPALHDRFKKLPAQLQKLFLNAFDLGHTNPQLRPTAEIWGKTIYSIIQAGNLSALPLPAPQPSVSSRTSKPYSPSKSSSKIKMILASSILVIILFMWWFFVIPHDLTPTTKEVASSSEPQPPTIIPTAILEPTATFTPEILLEEIIETISSNYCAEVNTANLNLRAGAGTTHKILARHSKGTKLQVVEQAANSTWVKVIVVASGSIGWMNKNYLRILSSCLSADPSPTVQIMQNSPTLVPISLPFQILSPREGATLRCKSKFAWQDSVSLPPGHVYEIIFWKAGQNWTTEGRGATKADLRTSRDIDLNYLNAQRDWFVPGEYEWGVLDITTDPYTRHRMLEYGGQFTFVRDGTCP